MANKKKKNQVKVLEVVKLLQPPKAAKKTKRRSRKEKKVKPQMGKMVKAVCALTDPFCHNAQGVKWPDGTNVKTIPYQIRYVISPTNSAAGAGALVIIPNPFYGYNSPTLGGGTYTVSGGFVATPVKTFLATNTESYRMVNFGIRIFNTASATTASGLLIVGTNTNSSPVPDQQLSGTSFPQGQLNYADFQMVTLSLGAEVCCVAKCNEPSCLLFQNSSDLESNIGTCTPGFDYFTLDWSGGTASVSTFSVEIIANIEFTLPMANAFAVMSTPPAPKNPLALAASQSVKSVGASIVQASIPTFGRMIEDAASSALSFLSKEFMPVASTLAMIVD